ncbi:hypothetical protein H4219_004981 [Mycoemilia scoparia]|uniref:Uncharacterized protein n=1 Tax=Mycoemilia scoparia TaxID=417184 RepID=A0A9W7ZVL5_9FUNG|nr:hypothetical protein H4219_004981 [Mycoemilia scoparia]
MIPPMNGIRLHLSSNTGPGSVTMIRKTTKVSSRNKLDSRIFSPRPSGSAAHSYSHPYIGIGHKHTSYLWIRRDKPMPSGKLFCLKCPKLNKLRVEHLPEFIRKLSGFTKLNPTITDLCIDEYVHNTEFPALESPMLTDILNPLHKRLTSLELGAIIHLPSLSFLLEKLTSLDTLIIHCCALETISDIFVKGSNDDQDKMVGKKSHAPSLVEDKICKKAFYNLTFISIGRFFTPKDQLNKIIKDKLVFNTKLLPSLSKLQLTEFYSDVPDPTIPGGIELERIHYSYFFESVVHQTVTKLEIFITSPEFLVNLSRSFPNLEQFEIEKFKRSQDQSGTIKAFRLIAGLFPKLTKINIGMWGLSLDDRIIINYDTILYSEPQDYASESRDLEWLDNATEEDIFRLQAPLSFSCANNPKILELNPLSGGFTPDAFLSIAQFINLEYLSMKMSSLDDIEVQAGRIRNYYGSNHKAFGKMVYFKFTSGLMEPNVDRFKYLIKLFPVLRVYAHSAFFIGLDREELLESLRQVFPNMVFAY